MKKHHSFGRFKKTFSRGIHKIGHVATSVGNTVKKIGGGIEKGASYVEKGANKVAKLTDNPYVLGASAIIAPEILAGVEAVHLGSKEVQTLSHKAKQGGHSLKKTGERVSYEGENVESQIKDKVNTLLKTKPNDDKKINVSFHH